MQLEKKQTNFSGRFTPCYAVDILINSENDHCIIPQIPELGNNGMIRSLKGGGAPFITDETGKVLQEAGLLEEKVIFHAFDLDAIEELRF